VQGVITEPLGDGRRRVLVADDDVHVRTVVAGQLAAEHFEVDQAADGAEAIALVRDRQPDLVILDLSLPGRAVSHGFGAAAYPGGLDPGRDAVAYPGGLDLLVALRSLPVIVLGARSGELDRITALDLGADDYVTKPFSPRELAARVRSVLRRAAPAAPAVLEYGRLRIDLMARSVDVAGRPVDLTAREFDLLAFLAATPRHTFSRSQLLAEVWSSATRWQLEATVTEHMYRLRHKLETTPGGSRWLRTVRNVGYLFDPGPERA
jgi:two-component system phosphate regulon response regulator PhoB